VLLQRLSERLSVLFPGGETMCTGCCVDLDVDERGRIHVAYANGGGPPILHWSGESVRAIYGETPFLGIGDPVWPEPLPLSLKPGDLLLVATDGLPEQQNEQGTPFEDVIAAAPVGSAASAADFLERLLATFDAFRGAAPLADDVTLIAIRASERSQFKD
jgi:serine phosphatase RsbU (regulator of sigma subunit)